MVMAFNTEIEQHGVVYHIQTEPRKDARIETVVYLGGAVIHSLTASYQEMLHSPDYSDEKLKRLLTDQHRQVVSRIRAGELALPESQPRAADREHRLIIIHLNGEPREVPEGLTLETFLDWLKLPADRVAIERNLEIVSRNQWGETPVQIGDRLEVVHFVGGGSSLILDLRFVDRDSSIENRKSKIAEPYESQRQPFNRIYLCHPAH